METHMTTEKVNEHHESEGLLPISQDVIVWFYTKYIKPMFTKLMKKLQGIMTILNELIHSASVYLKGTFVRRLPTPESVQNSINTWHLTFNSKTRLCHIYSSYLYIRYLLHICKIYSLFCYLLIVKMALYLRYQTIYTYTKKFHPNVKYTDINKTNTHL